HRRRFGRQPAADKRAEIIRLHRRTDLLRKRVPLRFDRLKLRLKVSKLPKQFARFVTQFDCCAGRFRPAAYLLDLAKVERPKSSLGNLGRFWLNHAEKRGL